MSFTVSRLTHLADVTITAPIDGHYLRHNGMEWVNSPILAGDIPPLPGLDLIDAGTAFVLTLQSDSTPDFTADHTLTFDTADGARLFIISGDGAIDQDVRVAASPTFAGVTLSGLTATRLVATNAANLLVSSDIVNWIIGTANQVIVTDNLDGTVTLSLPQDIDTSADVEFDSLILDDLTASRLVSTNAANLLVSSDIVNWIDGTANKITVTDDLDGTVTLTIPDAVTLVNLTVTDITIGANTIDTTEWANLDGLDQTVATTSSPTFAGLTLTGNLAMGGNDITNVGDITITGDLVTSLTPGHIVFPTTGGTLTGSSKLVFDSANGRLGIGTDTPTDKLHVNGNLRVQGSTTSYLFFADAVTERIGIGTNTPSELFHVSGGLVRLDGTNYPQYIMKSALAGSNEWSFFGTNSGWYVRNRTNGNNPFGVLNGAPNSAFRIELSKIVVNYNSNDYDFQVKSTGNANMFFVDASTDRVGIGTATLSGRLTVDQWDSAGAIPVLTLDQGDIDQPFIEFLGGTIYAGKTGADEYLMVKDPNGNTRYLRMYT